MISIMLVRVTPKVIEEVFARLRSNISESWPGLGVCSLLITTKIRRKMKSLNIVSA